MFFRPPKAAPILRSQPSIASRPDSSAASRARAERSRRRRSISRTATSTRLAFARFARRYPRCQRIPRRAAPFLDGLDIRTIDASQYRPAPSHFSLDDALAWIETIRPRRAILTNLHTDLDRRHRISPSARQASNPSTRIPSWAGVTCAGRRARKVS